MLDNIGAPEIIVIVLVGLFIFGPDRLPKAISDGLRMVRTLREMARNATGDLSKELGTNIELEDLNPKTFLRKHILTEADELALRKPFQDLLGDAKSVADNVKRDMDGITRDVNAATSSVSAGLNGSSLAKSTPRPAIQASYDDVT